MILADPRCFTQAHFEAHRGVAPAPLCELVVYCLELVSQLSSRGLNFRFKGGNSLLVLLEEPRRFSIDVDIATTESKERLADLVQGLADASTVFRRVTVRQPQTKPWLPLLSFKLYFDSAYAASAVDEPPYVMLDAVLHEPPYPGVRKQVRCGSLYASGQSVELPSISGLIADKLLCVGPSTMGIPLGKGKDAQRLKHVFDVATLLRQPHDLQNVGSALDSCMRQENALQQTSFSLRDVLEDTRRFCSEAVARPDEPHPEEVEPLSYLGEIASGFQGFRTCLFREAYDWNRLRGDCGRLLELIAALGG